MIEVFWKKGEREIGEKNWNNKLKCRNPKILTDVGMYQPTGLGPPVSVSAGLQFRKGI